MTLQQLKYIITVVEVELLENRYGDNIISVPLVTDEKINVGWIRNEKAQLSEFALSYIEELEKMIADYGY